MKKNKDFEIEPIYLPSSSLDIELAKDKWFDIEFYSNFKVSCVFTSADSSDISSSFADTHFEPLITFTFHTQEESSSKEEKVSNNDNTPSINNYFCFCSQETLAIIQFKKDQKTLNTLLNSMSHAFLLPTTPIDSKEFISNTDDQSNIYPFNLVSHEDPLTELNHFYEFYSRKINFNSDINHKALKLDSDKFSLFSFLSISLKPALLFLIRRNYFPLMWFIDQSFSTHSLFSTENFDKNEFTFNDFIFLRDILFFDESQESLYIHKDTGSLFSIKTYKNAELFNFEKEVFYSSRSRFIRPCYGFIAGDGTENKGSLILEFMSDGKATDVLKNEGLEAIMKSKIITEVILGIDTLNANGYVVTSFDKDFVYFDCNVSAYISDLRSVKLFDDTIDTKTFMNQTKLFANFIKDVGGPDFPQFEYGPIIHLYEACMTGSHDENPTIFSMVNCLKKRRLFFSWPMKDLIYDALKELFEQQVINYRKDIEIIHKRATSSTNKDPDAELIIELTFFTTKISSPQKALDYLANEPFSERCQPITYNIALYFELMKIPEFISLISTLASKGHVLSQAYLGVLYYRGKHPNLLDMNRSFEWLNVASDNNSPEGLFILGCLYEEGTFVERDINKALKYYMKSSDMFFHRANYRIGRLFYYGLGVPQDDEMAYMYLSMASLANIIEANSYLAKIIMRNQYDFTLNLQLNASQNNNQKDTKNAKNNNNNIPNPPSSAAIEKNIKTKKMIFNLLFPAYNVGVVRAQRILHKFLTKDSIPIDKQDFSFLKKAVTSNDVYSIKKYADMIINDENEAYKLYKTAAEFGEKASQYHVGIHLIEQGDIDTGLLYIRESVRLCHPEAQYYLGKQYLLGRPKGVVDQNIIKGVGLIQMAMNQNYSLAFEKIGELFLDNNFLMADYIQAFYYLNFAYRFTTPTAPYFLGIILEEGLGCKPDHEMAAKMYKKCLRNSPRAIIRYLSMIRNGKGFPKKNPTEAIDQMKKIINTTQRTIPRINSEYLRYVGEGYCGVELNYTDSFLQTTTKSVTTTKPKKQNKKNPLIGSPPHIIYNNVLKLPLVQPSELISKVIQMPDVYDDGDMQGLFIQGRMIEMGDSQRGINGDPKRAFKIYKKCAIEGNNVNAMYEIGRCYERGDCVNKDLEAAFRWYLTCINETNYENGIYDDGSEYDDNYYYFYDEEENNYIYNFDPNENEKEGEEENKKKEPLKSCQVEACFRVGAMLHRGIGVKKKNINEAKKFLLKAAEYKHTDAQAELGYLFYDIGDTKNSVKYCSLAADGGNPFAQILLTQLCHDNLIPDKDGKQYLSCFQKAEQKGVIEAQFVMGKFYEDESNDMNRAFHWYAKAAQRGFKEAEYKIAQMHLEGLIDNRKDSVEALKWFKRASRVKEKERKCKSSIHPFDVKVSIDEGMYLDLNADQMSTSNSNSNNNKMAKKIITKNNINSFINTFISEKKKRHERYKLVVDESEEEDLDQIYVNDYISHYYDYLYQKDKYFNFKSYLKRNEIKIRHKYPDGDDPIYSGPKQLTVSQRSSIYASQNFTRYTDPNLITSEVPSQSSCFLASSSTSTLSMLNAARIYNRGGPGVEINKRKAAKWFRYAAEYGNSSGMYSYASLLDKDFLPVQYQSNPVLSEREKESLLEWFSMAAKRGETKAFGKIMHMYACGMHRKKIETPIRKLQEMIDKNGDVNAMIDLGDIFYYGNPGGNQSNVTGQIREVARAIDLYQRAAEKGNDIAQYKLAVIYEAADKSKAASLFEKSAENGNLASMVFIADIYNKNKQYTEALKWYERCSRAGLTHAKLVIGRMYAEGQGTSVDKKKAEVYFKEASECGSAEGMFECAKLLVEDQQPNFKKIMSLLFTSADGGCGEAMNMLGLMYREGLGVIPDELRAKVWFTRGSDRGCNQATLNLAKMNYEGLHQSSSSSKSGNKDRDIPAAIELFNKASKKGSIVAKLYLAKIIKSGEGCQKDEVKAGELYMEAAKMEGMEMTDAGLEDLRLAADCKNPAACNIIAQRIIDGREDRDNEELKLKRLRGKISEAEEKERKLSMHKKAYSLFLIAAKVNITNALFQLGLLFESGKGASKNHDKAISYYKEAAEEGSELAAQRLHEIAPDMKFKKYDECPTNKTADKPIKMHAYECLTCNLFNNHVICPKCANSCHKNHSLIDIGIKPNVFCCCTLCKGALKH
ncbi:hypothetical protein M9Y10_016383 [Tritrichomonas musculus]|uniref:UBR-type domain-containing protein n=1 Tax=Tritrichomonas musculus TaxID=1915356 RepID=A0ABR2HW28_9EUKA